MMRKQKEQDDRSIAIILKALEQGIELENDEVYDQLIKEYPHYEHKREVRQNKIKQLKKKIADPITKAYKYKFEKYRGLPNLESKDKVAEVIDVEPVPPEEDVALQIAQYRRQLEEYEAEEKQIRQHRARFRDEHAHQSLKDFDQVEYEREMSLLR